MAVPSSVRVVAIAALLVCLAAADARADAIDGDWCHSDGRSLTINGAAIRTPTGVSMTGSYGRHDFSYVAPSGDANNGRTIAMRLMDENTVSVRISGAEAPAQIWKRCRLGTS
jgi:hypothetical protein